MKEKGLGTVTILTCYDTRLRPHKQIVIYHKDIPSFARVEINTVCDFPTEEFYIRENLLPSGTSIKSLSS